MKRESSPVLIPAMRSSNSRALALLTWQHNHTGAIVFVCVLASPFPLICVHLQLRSIQEKQAVNLKISHVCVLTPFSQCGLILQRERCFNVYSMFNCDITKGSSNPDVVFSCQLAQAVKVFSNLKAAVWRLNFVADGSDIGWNTEHCKGFSSETKPVACHREWKNPQI